MKESADASGLQVPGRTEIMDYVRAEAGRILRLPEREIRPDSDLTAMMDSLDAIGMLLALNRRFGVDLEETSIVDLRTPEGITNIIVEIIEGKVRFSVIVQSS
jgi:acyl carrier protein